MKLSYASAAVAVMALGLIGCGKKESAADDVIATVNGDSITSKDYLDYIERKSTVSVVTPNGPTLARTNGSVGLQALQDMVNQKLMLQLAKEQGVMPTDADVNKELDFRSAQTPNYMTILTQQAGMTLDQIKREVLYALVQERLVTKGVSVTMAEVDQYIKENPQQFLEPAKANLLWIVVSEQNKTKQVDQDLAGGASFQTVATRYSEAPQARETGGQYPVSQVDQMPARLRPLVEKTSALKTTDWLRDGKNFVKFYVQSKTPAKKMELNETKKQSIQRELAMQRGSLATDLGKRQRDKLKASKIEVVPTSLRIPWNQLVDQLKKDTSDQTAPPTSGSTTGATTGAPTTTAGAPTTGTPGAAPTGTDKK